MGKCSVDSCERSAQTKGLCVKHYKQILKHGRLMPERERKQYHAGETCSKEGCHRKIKAKGYCDKHYRQLKQHGRVLDRTVHDRNEIIEYLTYAEVILYDINKQERARTIIDLCDIKLVKPYKWGLDKDGYAVTHIKGKRQLMHRFLLGVSGANDVDHINGDRLDNRRKNIRVCSRSQNNMNIPLRVSNSSGVTGVNWSKGHNAWEARIWYQKRSIHLGIFKDFYEAVKARKKAEAEYYKEFAYNPDLDRRQQCSQREVVAE